MAHAWSVHFSFENAIARGPPQVIVKTTTEYQLQQKKKKKLYVPGIKKLNINLYEEVSEKVKVL